MISTQCTLNITVLNQCLPFFWRQICLFLMKLRILRWNETDALKISNLWTICLAKCCRFERNLWALIFPTQTKLTKNTVPNGFSERNRRTFVFAILLSMQNGTLKLLLMSWLICCADSIWMRVQIKQGSRRLIGSPPMNICLDTRIKSSNENFEKQLQVGSARLWCDEWEEGKKLGRKVITFYCTHSWWI